MKRFFSWKWFRRGLIGVAVLITLLAVIWTVENIRGNHAWSQYKTQMEAKGEKFDWRAFVPPTVPDEKNFAMIPLFQRLPYASGHGTEDGAALVKIDPNLADSGKRVPPSKTWTDLEAYQEFYRGNTNYPQSTQTQTAAEDVLTALSRFDKELELLQQAANERPSSRFPVRYEDHFQLLLPHLSPLRGINSTLLLRGTAYLELGRNEEASRDAELAFRLTDSIKEEPLLISYLVRMAMLNQSAQLVKEGILRHAWNETQLKSFQNRFAQFDLLSDYHYAIRGERAMFIEGLDAMGRGEYSLSDIADPSNATFEKSTKRNIFPLPRGWLKQNQRVMSRWHQDFSLNAVSVEERRVFPKIPAAGEEMLQKLNKSIPNPHNFFARLLLPAVVNVSKRAAENQNLVDHAILACALERYYLAHKSYPDSLQDLVPEFVSTLPHDIIAGAPLRYQRTSNGFYKLYSVGWDGKDDGGKVVARDSKEARAGAPSDWVWQFPE